MNNVSLVGRPTRDPELRYTTTGVPVCSFILAVDRDFKSKERKREEMRPRTLLGVII